MNLKYRKVSLFEVTRKNFHHILILYLYILDLAAFECQNKKKSNHFGMKRSDTFPKIHFLKYITDKKVKQHIISV